MSALALVVLTVVTSTRDVRALSFSPDGALVATTTGGVVSVGPEGERLVSFGASETRPLVLPDGTWEATLGRGLLHDGKKVRGVDAVVWSVAAAPGGGVYAATASGLLRVSRGKPSRVDLAGDIRAVASDGKRVVAGTWGEGARFLDGRPVGPRDLRVQALALSGDRLAIGTPDGGILVDLASGTTKRFAGGGLAANDLTAVSPAPDGGAWLATFDRGLQRVDADGHLVGAWRERDGLLDDHTNALAPGILDGTPGVFIATERGVAFRGDAGGFRAFPPFDHHFAAVATVGGTLYAGASDGLYVLRGDRLERIDDFPLRRVTAIAPTPAKDGRPRYVGSAAGLVVHDRADRIIDTLAGLPEDWVTALAPTGDGVLVGTYRHGVVRVDARGRVTPIAKEGWVSALWADPAVVLAGTLGDGLLVGPAVGGGLVPLVGLPGHDVTGVARAPRAVWIATRSGLAKLSF